MSPKQRSSKLVATFNKYGLYLRWPWFWIIIIGIILLFLTFSIAGMEIGHTVFDLRRSTAFGGFILFIPLLICSIFVLITACKPSLILLRIAVILCWIMIFLCMLLIAYDILVLIDPTRCFFLNCNDAIVNGSNSTTNIIGTGWPLNITWPSYFQTNMNAIRIFQSIQLLCAGLFILFAALYILTYYIYRHIKLIHQHVYNTNHGTFTKDEPYSPSSRKYNNINNTSYSPLSYNPHRKVTTYTIEAQPYTITQPYYSSSPVPPVTTVAMPRKTKTKTFIRPRANSLNYERICTRCNREPRIILATNYERENYFQHLCLTCNQQIANNRRKLPVEQLKNGQAWRP